MLETQQDEHMVERAMGENLKGLEGKQSLEKLRRQTGRTLEKGWQDCRLRSVNKRWRGSRTTSAKGSAPNVTRTVLEWEGYREAREQEKGGAAADTS